MTDATLPPELRSWVAGHLPALDQVDDFSWPRSSSRVWRVGVGGSEAFVKVSPSDRTFRREVAGYAYTRRILTRRQAPRLLACDPDLRAILTTALPGSVVRGLPLDRNVELRLHEDAGRLLRHWHDRSDSGAEEDRAAVRSVMQAYAREAADCRVSLVGHLSPDVLALVEAAAAEIPGLAERLPLVFLHGDYATRNWLYDAESGGHALIDFEAARYGLVVEEFVWLNGALWPERTDLHDAFFTGYGHPPQPAEARLLRLLTVRLGASYLLNGLLQGREDLQARGRLALDRMAALADAETVGRFAESTLPSILDHQGEQGSAQPIRRSEAHSLQPVTSPWPGFSH
ncbi:aminoglycoside phosphotransferase family protein [Kitasatospora misakiensis]|uniref:Aminoglycoside phosphotransferase family protein n=1 Tax=Kitasatospora misakiensis TaxID=67330 RepID=A0ABW0X8T6_9ACTN